MASLFMADTEFPQFREGQSTDEKLQMILNYMFMMQEQFKYALSNIGDKNINSNDIPELIKTINSPILLKVEDTDETVAEIKLSLDGIDLTGIVTFNDLEHASGGTVIDGGNIKTGTITGINIKACNFICSEKSGEIKFLNQENSDEEGASISFVEKDSWNNNLVIKTFGELGRNHNLVLKSSGALYLEAEDGVFVNGERID